jgi:hypothetical protein
MKKTALLLIIGLGLISFSAASLQAQYDRFNLAFNWGVVTDKSFDFKPFFWTSGLTFEFLIGNHLALCPEGFIIVHNFDFGGFLLTPALILNLHAGKLFIGGGLTKWWEVGSEVEATPVTDFSLKLNAGFRGDGLKLTFFAVTPFDNILDDMAIGATLGFYF